MELSIEIVEGRGFPKCPYGHRVVIQTTYGNQMKETLPSSMGRGTRVNDPFWKAGGATLNWNFTKSEWRKCKSVAPRMKLNVYTRPAGDRQTSQRAQFVGFCMVDLRHAEVTLADPQAARFDWYSMSGHNPGQLKIRVRLRGMLSQPPKPCGIAARQDTEEDHEESGSESEEKEEEKGAVSQQAVTPRSSNEYAPHALREAAANDEPAVAVGTSDDAIVIGERDKADQHFNLTISLTGVSGLHSILSDRKGPINLWFSYKIFGVLIQTDTFTFPKASKFPNVEDSFVLRSNVNSLIQWTELQPPVHVMLCTEGEVLALVEIPLDQLVKRNRYGKEYSLASAELRGGFDIQPLKPLAASARYEVATDEFTAQLHGIVSLMPQAQHGMTTDHGRKDRRAALPPRPPRESQSRLDTVKSAAAGPYEEERTDQAQRQIPVVVPPSFEPASAYTFNLQHRGQIESGESGDESNQERSIYVDVRGVSFNKVALFEEDNRDTSAWLELGIGRFVCLCNERLNLKDATLKEDAEEDEPVWHALDELQMQAVFPLTSTREQGGDILTVRVLSTNATPQNEEEIPDDYAFCIGFANSVDLCSGAECSVPLYKVEDLQRYQSSSTDAHGDVGTTMQPVAWVALAPGEASTVTTPQESTPYDTDSENVAIEYETKKRLTHRDPEFARRSQRQVSSRELSEENKASIQQKINNSAMAANEDLNHFRLSFEVRSVKSLSQSSNVYCTSRFDQYKFAHAAIHRATEAEQAAHFYEQANMQAEKTASSLSKLKLRTRPTVHVSPNSEENLPHSFRLFEFVSSGEKLVQELQKSLKVDLWHRDRKRFEHDQKIGTAELCPAEVVLSKCLYRCPFTQKIFSSKANYNRHIMHLKANQDTSRPFASATEKKHKHSEKRMPEEESDEDEDKEFSWDIPPVTIQIFDVYLPLLAFAKESEFNAGLGFGGPRGTEGYQAPKGTAPGGEPSNRVQVTGYVRSLVILEDFGPTTHLTSGSASSKTAVSTPSRALEFYGIHSIPANSKYSADPEEGRPDELLGKSAAAVGSAIPYPPGLAEHFSRQEAFSSGNTYNDRMELPAERKSSQAHSGNYYSGVGSQGHWSASYQRATSFDDLPPAIRADALRAFERWREEAEESWIAELKEKERKKLNELEKEYQEREEQRQAEMKSLTSEYATLESQLKKAIAKAERRALTLESKLTAADEQAKSKLASVEEKEKRVEEEVQMKVASEKAKNDALKERIKSLESEVDRERKRSEQVQDEFTKYRSAQSETPEAALREKISKIEGENLSLQRELNDMKEKYNNERQQSSKLRAQVFVLAREVSKYRAKEREAAEQELARLRVEYLAREERYVLDDDRATLRKIREQLHQVQDEDIDQSGSAREDPLRYRGHTEQNEAYESKVTESLYPSSSAATTQSPTETDEFHSAAVSIPRQDAPHPS
eukprot:gb/GECG01003266.1/.p1 GENE.gb/GECG01003266.1/~~gb/GECG01003266.1/.p1  ORF type:complete len:1441 (+),score=250.00 gb/GECG01003266.1/:1-4323(+)